MVRHDTLHAGNEQVANCHLDFFSLYFVQSGRGTHWIDGVPYGVARGDVYAMGLGMTHWFAGCENLHTHTLHFAPGVFDAETLPILTQTPGFQPLFVEGFRVEGLRAQGQSERWLHLSPESYAPVAEMLRELEEEWARETPEGTLLTRGLFLRLLVHLARCYAAREAQGAKPAGPRSSVQETTVAAAVRYLEEHFTEPLRVEQAAAAVFLSPDRFTEVFSGVMGRTPRDYIRHLRIERACLLLAATEESVSEIGQQSGFGEAAYFARAFHAATGQTPRAYRAEKRGGV